MWVAVAMLVWFRVGLVRKAKPVCRAKEVCFSFEELDGRHGGVAAARPGVGGRRESGFGLCGE